MDIAELKTNRIMQAIVAIFLVAVLLMLGIVLTVQKLPALKAQRLQAEDTLAISTQNLNRLLVMAANEEQTKLNFEAMQSVLPRGISQDEVFDSVQHLSEKYKLKSVDKINFTDVTELDGVNGLPMQISLVGEYSLVMAMLEEYTMSKRLTLLDKVSVHSEVGALGLVRADVGLSVYFR